jgi:hypothetical protein
MIAAGVYRQLIVSTFSLLAWFFLALLSDTAFVLVLGTLLRKIKQKTRMNVRGALPVLAASTAFLLLGLCTKVAK